MQTNQNPTGLKFGNLSAYCDFRRYGNGEAGCEHAPDYACRINNTVGTTADLLLWSEIETCDPVADWPTIRSPAEQLRLALNAAERVYRSMLANLKASFYNDEKRYWQMLLVSSRAAYQKARRERDQWARGKTTLDASGEMPRFPKCGTDHDIAPYVAYVTGQVS